MNMKTHDFYSALSHAPVRAAGHDVDLNVYRRCSKTTYGRFKYQAPWEGLVQTGWPGTPETHWTNEFEIAWTKVGDRGPLCLLIHGVPCNRGQWEEVQRFLGRFCETIAIDMLGMGESTQPRLYGRRRDPKPNDCWHWNHDVDYIDKLMQHEYPGRKFILIADDWGSGIASHYAAAHNDRLNALIQFDAIAFDGYPVNEIQAIGRASQIPNTAEGDQLFAQLFGAFDQTLVQILKTMVWNPAVYNQYKLRLLTFPYVEGDYHRNNANDGVTDVASSVTLRQNVHNMRVLADRAAILSPALLLPYCPRRNPRGVDYSRITVPALIGWGEYDNMMPAAQTQRFAHVLGTDDVQIAYIPRAGHFAHTDQPLLVADTILNFIRRVMGRESLADIYLGNQGIWKGDERAMLNDLRKIYSIDAQSLA
ncbi:MAG: alpha/beta hydrolase [Gammaproteobacteria bacterium]|nr:alpha/beta hydrolase [Gammaproteobacteria bacterium]